MKQTDARYRDHGDLELTKEERRLLRSQGFEPWGNHGWVLFGKGEFGGTCYDDKWAMRDALIQRS